MLKLHTLAEWMYGFLEPAPPYGLPEEMYNDVMPSGVHRYNRYNDGLYGSLLKHGLPQGRGVRQDLPASNRPVPTCKCSAPGAFCRSACILGLKSV